MGFHPQDAVAGKGPLLWLQLIPCSTCIPYNLLLGEPAVEPGAAPPGDLEPRAHPPGQVHLHRLPAKVHQHYFIYIHASRRPE